MPVPIDFSYLGPRTPQLQNLSPGTPILVAAPDLGLLNVRVTVNAIGDAATLFDTMASLEWTLPS